MSRPAPRSGRRHARVAVVSPQEVVAAGLRALLARADGAVHLVTEHDGTDPPDVVLYDVLALHLGDGSDLDRRVRSKGSVVVALGRELRPDLEARALERGAAAAVSIGITGEELIAVVRSAHEGPWVTPRSRDGATRSGRSGRKRA